ncbi:MAG: ABC transporter permease [Acholeplasmataceae bacterium]|jgi:oligopeptide transport system permease protein|nr:ABC transporter permease [Acholeplasmataceae bacterium]
MKNIDKSKLVLVHDADDRIVDQPLETKEIGYYRDSWNRFKKNKASLVAFVIIVIIFFFVLVGPHMKVYKLPKDNPTEALRFGNLTPKIPGFDRIDGLNGTKKLTRGKRFLTHMYHSEFGESIILSGFPEELKQDPNHPDYANVTELTVKVDYYRYQNYIMSYMPESYYGIIDSNASGGLYQDPLGPVRKTRTKEEFEDLMKRNVIIDILDIKSSPNPQDPDNPFYQYEVRENQFMAALQQSPEDTYFWFGTTNSGKDLFTELWKGARVSILMAVTVLVINSTIGLTLGSIIGYYGGIVDLIFDRFVEIISSIPFLVVLTLLTLRFGSATWVIVIAFTATGWIGSYGTGRMQFYRFKNREYVLAARTLGASDGRIMFKHIFPNTLGYIVTGYALAIPSFVFTEASYSFLGIINYAETTSVGMLLRQGQATMAAHPHLLIFPALYIAILMIAFNLFGNGLRDAFNPSLRGAE